MASFRGQEIFPMMSRDVPRHTRKVLRKKSEIFFFEVLTLVGKFRANKQNILMSSRLVATAISITSLWALVKLSRLGWRGS